MKVLTPKISRSCPCCFAYKLVFVDDEFTKPIAVFRGENVLINLLKKSINIVKSNEKHYNKHLIMNEEEEKFQSRNTCWICEKFIDGDDEKARDHCHITGKFRGAAHWSCNKKK